MKYLLINLMFVITAVSSSYAQDVIEFASATTVPNTFVAGETATAAKVNENFKVLATTIDAKGADANKKFNELTTAINTADNNSVKKLFVNKYNATDSNGIGSVTCSVYEAVVGGGCACEGNPSEGSNFGILFACQPAGNSFVGGCHNVLYDPLLAHSPVKVYVMCLSSTKLFNKVQDQKERLPNEKAVIAVETLRERQNAYSQTLQK